MAKKKEKYDVRVLLGEARDAKNSALVQTGPTMLSAVQKIRYCDKVIWLCGQVKKARSKN